MFPQEHVARLIEQALGSLLLAADATQEIESQMLPEPSQIAFSGASRRREGGHGVPSSICCRQFIMIFVPRLRKIAMRFKQLASE
jgi:hypothetical protein